MSRKLLLSAVLGAVLLLAVAGCGSSSGGSASGAAGSSGKGPILIGISAAKTGPLAPYDLQPGELFELLMKQVNQSGGVLGRKIEVKWLDSKSDKPTASTNAQLLISEGAVAILGTCDFDFGSPAVLTAVAHKIPGLFLCASGFKSADPAVVGQYGGSFGWGSDSEGAAMAEWMHATHPQWKRVYIEKDTSLEYSIDTANYFKARFQQLGGTICGQDTFAGSATLDLAPEVTRLRSAVSGCDAIYDGSWNPYGAQLIRAVRNAGINLPILSNDATQGTTVDQIAGKVSNFYAVGFACVPTYCKGASNATVTKLSDEFKAAYGQPLANPYPMQGGYQLANALVNAIKAAGSTDGTKIASILWNQRLDYLGQTMRTTPTCHRPHPAVYSIESWTNGVNKQIATWDVHSIPNLGDGNRCAGPQ